MSGTASDPSSVGNGGHVADGFDPTAIRADVVGSLLRPRWLLEARDAHARGEIDAAELSRIEDRAVDEAILLQEEAGLDVVTDGEMRRLSFQSQLPAAVSGFSDWDLDAFLWGHWRGGERLGDERRERPPLAVVDRLERRRSLCGEEFRYLRRRARIPVKITLPSPSLFAGFYDPERAPACYPDLGAFLDGVTAVLIAELAELASLGARYVQIDAPHYTMFLDPEYRGFYESRGFSAGDWLERALDHDNALVRARPDLYFAFHLCRGNQGSRWLTEGGYDPIAPIIFPRIEAQRLMLEYDDERSGDFAPLAHVPADKMVVLGLVTTKHGELEPLETLERRIEQASAYLPRQRLAVSTQCGFGTSVIGNALTPAEQRAKLELVARAGGLTRVRC